MGIDLTVSGETKLTGLVGGSGITSSFSPRMHTASFAEVGVDAVHLSFPITPEMLGDVARGLQDIAVGYNVTMPYKTYICELLDGLSPAARLMGAVNTVVVKDGKSYGHNTDGAGFSENLRLHGFDPSGKKVTIVGAGGAGSAVSTQLALDGAASISIFNIRDEFWDKTITRIESLAKETGVKVTLSDLAERDHLASSIAESDLFVNATRVGAGDLIDQCVIDEDMLHEGLTVADTVYNPVESKLIKMAKAHGLAAYGAWACFFSKLLLLRRSGLGRICPLNLFEKNCFRNVPLFSSKGHLRVAFLFCVEKMTKERFE